MNKLSVGLHGTNDHHVLADLLDNQRAELVAVSAHATREVPA
jgi:hypothetical protein